VASNFEVALYIVVTFVSSGWKLCKTVYCICVTTFWFVTKNSGPSGPVSKMTTVQTIGTVPLNAVLPSTPANWLYLESDCDGLSSDQVQTFCILAHLIWPPMSTLQGIDHAPYIVGSVRNQAQQLLRRRTPFTRDSVPEQRSCQFLDLNNLNCWFGEKLSATIASSLCVAKLIRKRCLSVLIDVAENDGSAPAVYTSQCNWHHYVFTGTRWWIRLQPCMQYIIVLRPLRQCCNWQKDVVLKQLFSQRTPTEHCCE
jgi:hypothetical protein